MDKFTEDLGKVIALVSQMEQASQISPVTLPKLVRDNCPALFPENTYIISPREYVDKLLNDKLIEELNEYLESGEVQELGDLVEVVYEILTRKHISIDDFDRDRRKKCRRKGGFAKGVVLVTMGVDMERGE